MVFHFFKRSALKSNVFNSLANSALSGARYLSTSNYYHFSPISALQKNLAKASALNAQIKSLSSNLNENLKLAIQDKLKYIWTYHSNALEGSKLSLGDTIFFLREGLTVSGRSLKDFSDAKNHSEVVDYLYEVVTRKRELDPYLMKEMNAMLLKGTEEVLGIDPLGAPNKMRLSAGVYKRQPNYVIHLDGKIHYYVDPLQVEPEMNHLFQWVNKSLDSLHPIIVSAIAHYNLVRIHPFEDGNGRGARILMNLILINKHYQPAIITVEDRRNYISTLKEADDGNINPFIDLVCNSLIKTQEIMLDEMHKYKAEACSTPSFRM